VRHARKLRGHVPGNAQIVEGDVLERGKLDARCAGAASCRTQ
jgi:hypothetical protein